MKYLVYIAPGIGDFMIAMRLLYAIKKERPESVIDILICATDKSRVSPIKELIALQTVVRNCYYYSAKEPVHSLMTLFRLRGQGYDTGIVLEPSVTEFLSAWPGRICNMVAEYTVGPETLYQTGMYSVCVPRAIEQDVYTHVEHLCEAVGLRNYKEAMEDFSFAISTDVLYRYPLMTERGGKIGICLGAGPTDANESVMRRKKAWPLESWSRLSSALSEDGYKIFIFGGRAENDLCRYYGIDFGEDCVNFVGNQTLEETLFSLRMMNLVIGGDTGMLHAAAIQNVATLQLFGCSDPEKLAPPGPCNFYIKSEAECSPCFGTERMIMCEKNFCMDMIQVESVYRKAREILSRQIRI